MYSVQERTNAIDSIKTNKYFDFSIIIVLCNYLQILCLNQIIQHKLDLIEPEQIEALKY